MEYMRGERDLLLNGVGMPDVRTDMNGRHVLVVVRGYSYKDDLRALKPYIMVKFILGLNEIPKPDDAVDALAVAIYHNLPAADTGWDDLWCANYVASTKT